MKGKRWAAGLLAAVVIAGGAPSVSMTIALASDETPFEPIDGNAEQKRKEKEAKEALDKALAAAASVYQAGQKNYRDTEWKAFVKAYERRHRERRRMRGWRRCMRSRKRW